MTITAEQERAAVVAWIERKICQYMEEGKAITPGSTTRKLWDEHVVALSCIGASIEKGDHWSEGGTL